MLRMTDYADSPPVPHNLSFGFILYNQAFALSISLKLRWRASCFIPSCQNENHKLQKENTMKTSTKDQAEGTFHEIKGKTQPSPWTRSWWHNTKQEEIYENQK
jgi:hypothetical protein